MQNKDLEDVVQILETTAKSLKGIAENLQRLATILVVHDAKDEANAPVRKSDRREQI